MKTAPKLLLICTLLFVIYLSSFGQEVPDTSLYNVETNDGNTYIGKIVSKDSEVLKFQTSNLGEIKIPVSTIKSLKQVKPSQIKGGEIWFESPHTTRYFYAPNGYGLSKDDGYYQNTWVLFNQVSYGFTNNFSLGVGLMPLFLLGADVSPVWITPKFSIPLKRDKWNLGAGGIIATTIGTHQSNPAVGMFYGVSTFGSRDYNFTLGAGYGFADKQWSSSPVVTLGSALRTGKRHFFLTENYVFFGTGETAVLGSLGGRFISKHLAVDYGFIIPAGTGINQFIAIPWLGITIPFTSKK